jgi:glutathione S-transferase
MALEEKRLSYEPVLLSFQAGDLKKAEYVAISPHAKVPAITDGDFSLYESQPILEYLEERYPEPALLPRDPAERARVRVEEAEAVVYFSEAFQKIARELFFKPADKRDEKALAEARAGVRDQLAALEARAGKRAKEYLFPFGFSRADVTWLPFVELAARAGVELEAAGTPWLIGWRERMRARPAYERTYPPHWRK